MKQIRGQIDIQDLELVRKKYGEPILCEPAPISIYKDGEHKGKQKINPQVSRFKFLDGRTVDVFDVGPKYYLHKNGQWRPLSEVCHGYGNHWINFKEDYEDKVDFRYVLWLEKRQKVINGRISVCFEDKVFGLTPVAVKRIYGASQDFYPDAGTGATTVDGQVRRACASPYETWGTLKAGAGTQAYPTDTDSYIIACEAVTTTDKWDVLLRSIFLFDTSTLDDDITISSATLSLYGTAKQDPGNITPDVVVVSSNPASNNDLVAADFSTLGATEFSDVITYAGYSTSGYNVFTLNASGLAVISKTNITKLGIRLHQYGCHTTNPVWSAGEPYTALKAYFADNGSNKPKLTVVYPGGAVVIAQENLLLMGIG